MILSLRGGNVLWRTGWGLRPHTPARARPSTAEADAALGVWVCRDRFNGGGGDHQVNTPHSAVGRSTAAAGMTRSASGWRAARSMARAMRTAPDLFGGTFNGGGGLYTSKEDNRAALRSWTARKKFPSWMDSPGEGSVMGKHLLAMPVLVAVLVAGAAACNARARRPVRRARQLPPTS